MGQDKLPPSNSRPRSLPERVEHLRAQIDDGTLLIDSQQVALALLRREGSLLFRPGGWRPRRLVCPR